jgi:hypothetical protein
MKAALGQTSGAEEWLAKMEETLRHRAAEEEYDNYTAMGLIVNG